MKLQANEMGSWRQVATFDVAQRDAVLAALPALARAIGTHCKWSVLHNDGKREWLGSLSDALAARDGDAA